MKKKIPIILFCIAIILVISVVIYSNNKVGKESDIEISQSDVTLTIKENTLTNTQATIIIENNSDNQISYGEYYSIEVKKNGKWHKINGKSWFDLSSTYLYMKESKEINLNWKDYYGKLKKGTYRIIKDIDYIYEEKKPKNINIAVEFVIS